MNKRKILVTVLGTVIALIIGFAVLLIWEMHKYVEKCPAITPLENITLNANSTIPVEDVAVVEKSV